MLPAAILLAAVTVRAVPAPAAPEVDGTAALRHARALASLGPHPWGSPRSRAAASYVASQLRAAGLSDVRLDEFEVKGVHGVNVTGVLRGTGPGVIVVGAHHDTAPDAPGAYDDGGGVGVMIELARAAAKSPAPARTLVFASWDGEEAWSTGLGTTTGSRAHLRALGPEARDIVAAVVVEMCGWAGGTPVLHPIPYSDPRRPGAMVVAPASLMSAALSGARQAGAPFGIGDPWIPWLYQPTVRTFRVGLYGDDMSFLQAGVPAVFASDSSFKAFYPWYHQAGDTADRLDPAALARMGKAVRGALGALDTAPVRREGESDWIAVSGYVAPRWTLLLAGGVALLPGLLRARASGGRRFLARLALSMLLAAVVWENPVPALWILAAPVLITGLSARRAALLVSLLPALALGLLGTVAWGRGFVHGTWLPAWYLGAMAAALALCAYPVVPAPGRSIKNGRMRPARVPRRSLARVSAVS
jgi:aminopeptidase YwaD